MGCETELLKWLSLKKEEEVLLDKKEKARLKTIKNQIKEHEAYMVEQGFKFNISNLELPHGEIYEL